MEESKIRVKDVIRYVVGGGTARNNYSVKNSNPLSQKIMVSYQKGSGTTGGCEVWCYLPDFNVFSSFIDL